MLLYAVENETSLAAAASLPGEIPADGVQHALLRKGLALWHELRGPRLFPSRTQLSPRALGPLLRHTVLVKVVDGGSDFQVRITGDAIAAVQDVPLQGLTTAGIDQKLPGYGALLRRFYGRACAGRKPLALRGMLQRATASRGLYRELLLLPLGECDEAVDHLVTFVVYLPPQLAS
ncbi:MAG: PAS domain-containing protein [Alphaproteobacteria bacterium]|nr:PAS domain-containing protein [Alphaproteobacteria bacterium]MBU6473866.1 PAS domain-containing protein [Alphaproteobacteria bacterium]MDE2073929.1 PAS domain-containing protein [Alphaproteobacteria bacterium]